MMESVWNGYFLASNLDDRNLLAINLTRRGVPVDAHTVRFGSHSSYLHPYYVGIARSSAGGRLIAVNSVNGSWDEAVSDFLTCTADATIALLADASCGRRIA